MVSSTRDTDCTRLDPTWFAKPVGMPVRMDQAKAVDAGNGRSVRGSRLVSSRPSSSRDVLAFVVPMSMSDIRSSIPSHLGRQIHMPCEIARAINH